MTRICLVVFCIILSVAFGSPEDSAQSSDLQLLRSLESRIIGGSIADAKRYPYFAWLNIFDDDYAVGWCGGTLIAADVVITAARCYERGSSTQNITVDVWVNSTTREYSDYEHYREAIRVVSHPNFSYYKGVDDIGLVFLDEPVLGMPMIRLNKNASLPANNARNPFTALGLGANSSNGYNDDYYGDTYDTFPENLMQVSLDTVPLLSCIKLYGSAFI